MKYWLFVLMFFFAFSGTEINAQHYRDDGKTSIREQRFFNRIFKKKDKEVRQKERAQRKLQRQMAREERRRQRSQTKRVRENKNSWGTAEGRKYHGKHTGPFADVGAWFSRFFNSGPEYPYQ